MALLVKCGNFIKRFAADIPTHALRVLKVEYTFTFIPELHPLVLRRQEARAPEAVIQRLVVGSAAAERRHDDVIWEVVIHAT